MSELSTHGWVTMPHRKADVAVSVQDSLDKIARLDPVLNAFVSITDDLAWRDAHRLRADPDGHLVSPLAGMTVAVKDNIDIGGYITTAGSPFLLDNRAARDAVVVARLREAGAIIVGKSQLHEFAYGATTKNHHFGACRNPWDVDRVPGGSSGGSGVAVAANMTVGALGTDTGGSVRIPAALTGVCGLRPTHGAVSSRGVFPLGPSIDTVGPMARFFEDVWALFTVIRGYDPRDPWAQPPPADFGRTPPKSTLEGLRIGVPDDEFWHSPDSEIHHAVTTAVDQLRDLGAEIVRVPLRGADQARASCNTLLLAEALALHEERLARSPELFDPDIRDRLELGADLSGVDVARAVGGLQAWRAEVLECFESVDLIAVPATPTQAPEINPSDTITTTHALTRYAYPWSAARVPAASIPCGFGAGGLPIGLQLVAGPWQEHVLAQAAIAFQRVTDFHLQYPRLP
ncbi:MAG: amidase [Pseudonocardia sp.]|nr:amidase [Pseudonocardia sp.]